jgi:hypothetical protein
MIGLAHARQKFLRQTSGVAAVPGSERVLYHGARAARTLLTGRVEPYVIAHVGLTKLYDQNSFTFGLGLGTRIFARRKFALRYEFTQYVFSSGRGINKWTNQSALCFEFHCKEIPDFALNRMLKNSFEMSLRAKRSNLAR